MVWILNGASVPYLCPIYGKTTYAVPDGCVTPQAC